MSQVLLFLLVVLGNHFGPVSTAIDSPQLGDVKSNLIPSKITTTTRQENSTRDENAQQLRNDDPQALEDLRSTIGFQNSALGETPVEEFRKVPGKLVPDGVKHLNRWEPDKMADTEDFDKLIEEDLTPMKSLLVNEQLAKGYARHGIINNIIYAQNHEFHDNKTPDEDAIDQENSGEADTKKYDDTSNERVSATIEESLNTSRTSKPNSKLLQSRGTIAKGGQVYAGFAEGDRALNGSLPSSDGEKADDSESGSGSGSGAGSAEAPGEMDELRYVVMAEKARKLHKLRAATKLTVPFHDAPTPLKHKYRYRYTGKYIITNYVDPKTKNAQNDSSTAQNYNRNTEEFNTYSPFSERNQEANSARSSGYYSNSYQNYGASDQQQSTAQQSAYKPGESGGDADGSSQYDANYNVSGISTGNQVASSSQRNRIPMHQGQGAADSRGNEDLARQRRSTDGSDILGSSSFPSYAEDSKGYKRTGVLEPITLVKEQENSPIFERELITKGPKNVSEEAAGERLNTNLLPETESLSSESSGDLQKLSTSSVSKPVDGGFTPWTAWSECSETCGSEAIRMRMRVCTNPPPSNGGKDCKGWRFEVKYCNLSKCTDDQEDEIQNQDDIDRKGSDQNGIVAKQTSIKEIHEEGNSIQEKDKNQEGEDTKLVAQQKSIHEINEGVGSNQEKNKNQEENAVKEDEKGPLESPNGNDNMTHDESQDKNLLVVQKAIQEINNNSGNNQKEKKNQEEKAMKQDELQGTSAEDTQKENTSPQETDRKNQYKNLLAVQKAIQEINNSAGNNQKENKNQEENAVKEDGPQGTSEEDTQKGNTSPQETDKKKQDKNLFAVQKAIQEINNNSGNNQKENKNQEENAVKQDGPQGMSEVGTQKGNTSPQETDKKKQDKNLFAVQKAIQEINNNSGNNQKENKNQEENAVKQDGPQGMSEVGTQKGNTSPQETDKKNQDKTLVAIQKAIQEINNNSGNNQKENKNQEENAVKQDGPQGTSEEGTPQETDKNIDNYDDRNIEEVEFTENQENAVALQQKPLDVVSKGAVSNNDKETVEGEKSETEESGEIGHLHDKIARQKLVQEVSKPSGAGNGEGDVDKGNIKTLENEEIDSLEDAVADQKPVHEANKLPGRTYEEIVDKGNSNKESINPEAENLLDEKTEKKPIQEVSKPVVTTNGDEDTDKENSKPPEKEEMRNLQDRLTMQKAEQKSRGSEPGSSDKGGGGDREENSTTEGIPKTNVSNDKKAEQKPVQEVGKGPGTNNEEERIGEENGQPDENSETHNMQDKVAEPVQEAHRQPGTGKGEEDIDKGNSRPLENAETDGLQDKKAKQVPLQEVIRPAGSGREEGNVDKGGRQTSNHPDVNSGLTVENTSKDTIHHASQNVKAEAKQEEPVKIHSDEGILSNDTKNNETHTGRSKMELATNVNKNNSSDTASKINYDIILHTHENSEKDPVREDLNHTSPNQSWEDVIDTEDNIKTLDSVSEGEKEAQKEKPQTVVSISKDKKEADRENDNTIRNQTTTADSSQDTVNVKVSDQGIGHPDSVSEGKKEAEKEKFQTAVSNSKGEKEADRESENTSRNQTTTADSSQDTVNVKDNEQGIGHPLNEKEKANGHPSSPGSSAGGTTESENSTLNEGSLKNSTSPGAGSNRTQINISNSSSNDNETSKPQRTVNNATKGNPSKVSTGNNVADVSNARKIDEMDEEDLALHTMKGIEGVGGNIGAFDDLVEILSQNQQDENTGSVSSKGTNDDHFALDTLISIRKNLAKEQGDQHKQKYKNKQGKLDINRNTNKTDKNDYGIKGSGNNISTNISEANVLHGLGPRVGHHHFDMPSLVGSNNTNASGSKSLPTSEENRFFKNLVAKLNLYLKALADDKNDNATNGSSTHTKTAHSHMNGQVSVTGASRNDDKELFAEQKPIQQSNKEKVGTNVSQNLKAKEGQSAGSFNDKVIKAEQKPIQHEKKVNATDGVQNERKGKGNPAVGSIENHSFQDTLAQHTLMHDIGNKPGGNIKGNGIDAGKPVEKAVTNNILLKIELGPKENGDKTAVSYSKGGVIQGEGSTALGNVANRPMQQINGADSNYIKDREMAQRNQGHSVSNLSENFEAVEKGPANYVDLMPWSGWSQCNATCGSGTQKRMRVCRQDTDSKPMGAQTCKDPLEEHRECTATNCTDSSADKFSQWSSWSVCSPSCGNNSKKTRTRTCIRSGGPSCKEETTQEIACSVPPCFQYEIGGKIGDETVLESKVQEREKKLWTPWSEWSACTLSCGGDGFAKRERNCRPGQKCTGPRYDTKECGMEPCPVDGEFTIWSNWSPCTPSCGRRAFQLRQRSCTNPPPSHGGHSCVGSIKETRPCAIKDCPVDGAFSRWSAWSACSKTCNSTALSRRERKCDNPPPRHGGKSCEGNTVELKNCGTGPCPVDGGFAPWSEWSHCQNVSCGTHYLSHRTRQCTNPVPQYGGRNCTQHWIEHKRCENAECPVDGAYSDWTSWSACPDKCSTNGYSHRRRTCNNPEPKNGGKTCVGPSIDARVCWRENCPVDGGFSPWSSWSECSKECGRTSISSRERYCTNPSPSNGGKPCHGHKFQIKICKSKGCKVDGRYTEWSEWSQCKPCGLSIKRRIRTCTNPPPLNSGKYCEGPNQDVTACPYVKCKDEGFGKWSEFGRCSKLCGGGAKMRRRSCTDPDKGCHGKHVELRHCNVHKCPSGDNYLVKASPVELCGFNPCKLSKCLGNPNAMCVTSSKCKPVYFDIQGNILEECKGDGSIITSSSPDLLCLVNPCQTSGCYTDMAARCAVSTDCKPIFLDHNGNKLDCRGLLKVPPHTVCHKDPCERKTCARDTKANCIADFACQPVFISRRNEILEPSDCDDVTGDKKSVHSDGTKEMESLLKSLKGESNETDVSASEIETVADYEDADYRNKDMSRQVEPSSKLKSLENELNNLKRSKIQIPRKNSTLQKPSKKKHRKSHKRHKIHKKNKRRNTRASH